MSLFKLLTVLIISSVVVVAAEVLAFCVEFEIMDVMYTAAVISTVVPIKLKLVGKQFNHLGDYL